VAAARELDLDVPEQVAVVGADHNAVGQLVSPRLTTVRIELSAMVSAFISATTPAPQGRTSVPLSPWCPSRQPDRVVGSVCGPSSSCWEYSMTPGRCR